MFGWFKKTARPIPGPQQQVAAPAATTKSPGDVKIAYARGTETWNEQFNLFEVAARVLRQRGYRVTCHQDRIEDEDRSFVIRPKVEGFQPLDAGGARTTTTIHISHPTLIPQPIFEFQHSTGDSAEDSIAKGFDQWAQVDYIVFVEALREKPQQLTLLSMSFPPKDATPARHRRVVLGPVAHYQQHPNASDQPTAGGGDKHQFCPCCLLTRSIEAFKSLLESDHFCAIRLFAMRNQDGAAQADCRINGAEFEEGKSALRKYVESWEHAGVEFRKQYVIIQSVPATGGVGAGGDSRSID